MIDWQNFFKSEDLKLLDNVAFMQSHSTRYGAILDLVNQKLWLHIQTAEKVYGSTTRGEYHGVPTSWNPEDTQPNTHEARIIDVRKL